MKTQIKLLLTDLIAVEVPSDATEVQVWNHGIGFKTKSITRQPDDTNGFFHLYTGLGRWRDFEILGEVTKEKLSSNLEAFLKFELICTENAFRNILNANGLNWVNPSESRLIKGKLIILKPIS